MENNVFFKIVCIDDNDVFEYRINEDTNRKTLDEIHGYYCHAKLQNRKIHIAD